jgi:hypothetical protein
MASEKNPGCGMLALIFLTGIAMMAIAGTLAEAYGFPDGLIGLPIILLGLVGLILAGFAVLALLAG